jgi:phosphoglucomutase
MFTEDDGRGAVEVPNIIFLCLQKTTVEALLKEHWAEYGRNFFTRYDYEGCDADPCNLMMEVREYLENNS